MSLNRVITPQKQPKNIRGAKGEGAVDDDTVTSWFKKFTLGCKNLDEVR